MSPSDFGPTRATINFVPPDSLVHLSETQAANLSPERAREREERLAFNRDPQNASQAQWAAFEAKRLHMEAEKVRRAKDRMDEEVELLRADGFEVEVRGGETLENALARAKGQRAEKISAERRRVLLRDQQYLENQEQMEGQQQTMRRVGRARRAWKWMKRQWRRIA